MMQRRPRRRPLVLTLTLLVGCSSNPAHLASAKDADICRAYGTYSAWFFLWPIAERYKREIDRRGLIPSAEWSLVERKRIQKGMSLCALYASWGPPLREQPSDDGGGEIQHVYQTGGRSYPGAVYTRDGRVEGWSY